MKEIEKKKKVDIFSAIFIVVGRFPKWLTCTKLCSLLEEVLLLEAETQAEAKYLEDGRNLRR